MAVESAETICVSSRGSLFTDVPVKLEIRSSGGTSPAQLVCHSTVFSFSCLLKIREKIKIGV